MPLTESQKAQESLLTEAVMEIVNFLDGNNWIPAQGRKEIVSEFTKKARVLSQKILEGTMITPEELETFRKDFEKKVKALRPITIVDVDGTTRVSGGPDTTFFWEKKPETKGVSPPKAGSAPTGIKWLPPRIAGAIIVGSAFCVFIGGWATMVSRASVQEPEPILDPTSISTTTDDDYRPTDTECRHPVVPVQWAACRKMGRLR